MPQTQTLSPEQILAVTERCRGVFRELATLRVQTGKPKMDRLDHELYAAALNPLKAPAQIDRLRAEIRRTCEFCPTAKAVGEMVADILGPAAEMIPAHYADTRRILARCDADREGRARMIEGITPQKAEENRERAREMIQGLAARSGLDRKTPTAKYGEAPAHLKGEMETFARRRAALEHEMETGTGRFAGQKPVKV